ncbi:MAG: cell division protein FtsZ [Chlorobiota bacterium]|jgi:cell division protein FtsZ|nr:cell division protein FtsZ [Chlorobiota bacterium]QQS66706.1 MAG: cell division protein FtsZ [Chlorobiota bacterium]
MIELDNSKESHGAKIKIVGVGGGGGNAVGNMIERGLVGCEFIAVNTDMQALSSSKAHVKIQIGKKQTRGLGAGATPIIGRESAMEDQEELTQAVSHCDMIFVTAGMGGGTGTGAAPVVAEIARSQGSLVVGVVTKPFSWEGIKRMNHANDGIAELRKHVDTLIIIPNQKLTAVIDKKTSVKDAFNKVNDVLYDATKGISEIIMGQGIINVDFADVRAIMKDMGDAIMGTGVASGENRATEAAQNAISSPLLDGVSIAGSQGVLINITCSSDMPMIEIDEAVSVIQKAAGDDANVIFGLVYNEDLGDEMIVTVVATGFNKPNPNIVTENISKSLNIGKDEVLEVIKNNHNSNINHEEHKHNNYERKVISGNVPNGNEELDKYNKPAFERRNVGIYRGGFDISKINSDYQNSQNVSEEVDEVQEARKFEKPAFLRRIMD